MDANVDTGLAGKAPKWFSTSLEGRYGRLNFINAYWIYLLILLAPAIFAVSVIRVATGGDMESAQQHPAYFVIMLLCLIPISRLVVLRLHDLNKPNTWLVPIIGLQILSDLLMNIVHVNYETSIVVMLITVAVWLIVMIAPGTKGENQYGAQPPRGSYAGLIVMIIMLVLLIVLAVVFASIAAAM